MHKLENLHKNIVIYEEPFIGFYHEHQVDVESITKKSAEITTDIAVKYKAFWLKQDVEWFFGHGINTVYRKKNGKEITERELFEEFINNHYDTNNR